MERADTSLALQLVALLLKEQVEKYEVAEALDLLCEAFHFKYAVVYEVDETKTFHKVNESASTKKCISAFKEYQLRPEFRKKLMSKTYTYLLNKEDNDANERFLLSLFTTNSLYVICVNDESLQIDYFIFLVDHEKAQLSESELSQIQINSSIIAKYFDIHAYQKKLGYAQTALESILDNTGIDIYVNDFYTHDILYVNQSMAAPYGGKEAFMNQKCWKILFPGQNGPCEFCPQQYIIDEKGDPSKVYTWDYQRAFDGSWFRVFSAAFRWVDGRLAHVVSSADITDNKKYEATIQYMANYDSLTNLPNRRKLIADCEDRINNTKDGDEGYLLFFDIDGFKSINDSLGHDAGDEFLIAVSKFFSELPLLKDGFYRNGGDEFIAIIDGPLSKENIRNLAYFIHNRFKQPWKLKAGEAYCNVSIGVACYPEDGNHAEELLVIADKAMYKAKKEGGASVAFGYELKK